MKQNYANVANYANFNPLSTLSCSAIYFHSFLRQQNISLHCLSVRLLESLPNDDSIK